MAKEELLRSLQLQDAERQRAIAEAKAAKDELAAVRADLERALQCADELMELVEAGKDSLMARVGAALERMAAAAEEANRLTEAQMARHDHEREEMREYVAEQRRMMERAVGAGGSPDWARINSQIVRAMAERVGVDPAKLPEIPEDPADIPGWLERMGMPGPEEEEGPAEG